MAGTGRNPYGYHHGDLRNALVAAAVELAAEGGPSKVVLREAARRVGVSSTAAYRHFNSHGRLLETTKGLCQQALADRMTQGLAAEETRPRRNPSEPEGETEADAACRRIKTIGRAYVQFATESPGLYRTAFVRIPREDRGPGPFDGISQLDEPDFEAFIQLSKALDALVAAGLMRPENRPFAEVGSWSLVHGLAMLILDGPLENLPAEQRDAVIEQSLDASLAGLLR
jgi:AcrR family transcriptional regulator